MAPQWGQRCEAERQIRQKETLMNSPDFSIENHGSILLFRMNTPASVRWVTENVQQDAQFFGDALVVEPRYARDLAAGIATDGLEVS